MFIFKWILYSILILIQYINIAFFVPVMHVWLFSIIKKNSIYLKLKYNCNNSKDFTFTATTN